MCSGAKEDMLAMSALMSALMTTGSSQVAPPCTTRCPTTSISWAEAMTLVSPYQRVPNKHSTTCFREQPWKLFLCTVPAEFFYLHVRTVGAPLDLALPQRGRRVVRQRITNLVEACFLTTGAGIEDKNVHDTRALNDGRQ